MKIGIDLDSTLNDLDTEWAQWITKTLDPSFRLEHWTDWDFYNFTPAGEKVFEYLDLPGTFRGLPTKEGAIEAVTELAAQGHELFVITACFPSPQTGNIISDKLDWLQEHFPMIDKKHIFFTNRKDLVDVDVLIDDAPHNIRDFPRIGIVFDAPWNQHLEDEYIRVKAWDEVLERIDDLACNTAADGRPAIPL